MKSNKNVLRLLSDIQLRIYYYYYKNNRKNIYYLYNQKYYRVMRFSSLATIINKAFQFVIKRSKEYNIDESHALKHSMDVFQYSNRIYDNELLTKPYLHDQQKIIFVSSIVHDMCDKKYVSNEKEAIDNIYNEFEKDIPKDELDVIIKIISTISYSKVKKIGYPDLGNYQLAYNIVRESDLLTAYDIDRCIMYQMMNKNNDFSDSLPETISLFEKRTLHYRNDNLFITNYSKNKSLKLHNQSIYNLENIKSIHKKMTEKDIF